MIKSNVLSKPSVSENIFTEIIDYLKSKNASEDIKNILLLEAGASYRETLSTNLQVLKTVYQIQKNRGVYEQPYFVYDVINKKIDVLVQNNFINKPEFYYIYSRDFHDLDIEKGWEKARRNIMDKFFYSNDTFIAQDDQLKIDAIIDKIKDNMINIVLMHQNGFMEYNNSHEFSLKTMINMPYAFYNINVFNYLKLVLEEKITSNQFNVANNTISLTKPNIVKLLLQDKEHTLKEKVILLNDVLNISGFLNNDEWLSDINVFNDVLKFINDSDEKFSGINKMLIYLLTDNANVTNENLKIYFTGRHKQDIQKEINIIVDDEYTNKRGGYDRKISKLLDNLMTMLESENDLVINQFINVFETTINSANLYRLINEDKNGYGTSSFSSYLLLLDKYNLLKFDNDIFTIKNSYQLLYLLKTMSGYDSKRLYDMLLLRINDIKKRINYISSFFLQFYIIKV